MNGRTNSNGGGFTLRGGYALLRVIAPKTVTATLSRGGEAVSTIDFTKQRVYDENTDNSVWLKLISVANFGEYSITTSASVTKTVSVTETKEYDVDATS